MIRFEPKPTIKVPLDEKLLIKAPKGTKKIMPVNPVKKTRKATSQETIEIITLGGIDGMESVPDNIGIELDHELILKILSTRYANATITPIHTRADLNRLAARKPDLVFSGVKFFKFDKGKLWLNDFLDKHHIAYIASSRASLNSESDKACAKVIMKGAGVITAEFFITRPGMHGDVSSIPLAFPLFVKPVQGGDSKGVDAASVVHDFEAFESKVKNIYDGQNSDALVETYLNGREYSVGILQDPKSVGLCAMPIEIIAAPNENGDRILDYDIKKLDMETVEAVTDKAVHVKLAAVAKTAFKALNGRLLGRIDIKMDSHGVPHFIEANLMPGLRRGYFYRACMLNLQMSYEEMILTIAGNALTHRVPSSPHSLSLEVSLMPAQPLDASILNNPNLQ